VKVWLYLGSVALILLGLWYFHLWSYDQGLEACEAAHNKAALKAATGVLDKAATTNVNDAKLNVGASEKVEVERRASADRLETIRRAPLTVEAPDAAACPDVLGPAFWRLYDGAPDGAGAPATASRPSG